MTPEDVAALRPWVLRYCKRRVHPNDAEDVAQDVLVHALQNLPSFVPSPRRHALRRWVAGIAANVVGMHHRRRRLLNRYMVEGEDSSTPGHEGQVEARAVLRFLVEEAGAAHLSLLAERIGTTAAELGAERGKPKSTIEWYTREARAALANALEHEASPPLRKK